MGFFKQLFKEPEVDMEKSEANARKMRALFNQVVESGDDYRLIFGYTEVDRRLERRESDYRSRAYRAGSFRLQRPDLLSARRNSQGVSQQVSDRSVYNLP